MERSEAKREKKWLVQPTLNESGMLKQERGPPQKIFEIVAMKGKFLILF